MCIHFVVLLMTLDTKVLALNLNWNGDKWNSNDWTFDNGNGWSAGNVFVSILYKYQKYSLGSILFFSFHINISPPTIQHFSYILQLNRNI